MALKNYRMPAAFAEAELTEKKSRFIAAVRPVSSEAEAIAFIKERRELYPDARHHVYAYDVNDENGAHSRYSDDGEPQGTGGMPVLDVIKKRGLTGAAVVVTRYFGGVLLGAAGLVRAYSGSASACIDAAGVAEMRYCRGFTVSVSYTDSGRVRNFIETAAGENRLIPDGAEYGGEVRFSVSVPEEEIKGFLDGLTELTSSRAAVSEGSFEFRRVNKEAGTAGGI